MIEIRIHGRGGQGGVTLAKILAATQHREGKSVQAFGIYAAERSGAPVQAFLRYDDEPFNNPTIPPAFPLNPSVSIITLETITSLT